MTLVAQPSRRPRSRDDCAFLPAALEIIETPLSPIRGVMILTICALVTAGLILGYFGQLDVIAAAQGKIQPVGRTKTVEPLEPGRVQRILVQNGQSVRAGDLLVSLDPTENQAEVAELTATLQGLRAEAIRRKAAIAAMASDEGIAPPRVEWGDTPVAIRTREQRVLDSELARLSGQVAGLDARRSQAEAEADRLRGTVAAQEALTATSKERLDMRNELLARNAESKASVIDAEETYRSQFATLAAQKGQLGESDATRLVTLRELQQARKVFLADNADRLAEAERRIDADQERLRKARLKVAAMDLRSPVDGTVEGLAATGVGQVLSSGEQAMRIVPSGGALEIEAYLPNSDAGFVQAGQTAVVKVQAFPFTDYGTVEAQVIRVGEDAIPLPEAEQQESNPDWALRGNGYAGGQRVQNLVFPVTLSLGSRILEAGGISHRLTPGMTTTVEIRTGSRRILSYLLAPLVETLSSAFRER